MLGGVTCGHVGGEVTPRWFASFSEPHCPLPAFTCGICRQPGEGMLNGFTDVSVAARYRYLPAICMFLSLSFAF